MGNGAAIKRGARAASGDVLVFMDADGQHDPVDIERLKAKLNEGYDMVVGARDWEGQAGVGRGVANTLYNWLASQMTHHKVRSEARRVGKECATTRRTQRCPLHQNN